MQPPIAHRDIKPQNVLIRRWHGSEPVSGSSWSVLSQGRDGNAEDTSLSESQPLRTEEAGSSSSRYHAVLMVCLIISL